MKSERKPQRAAAPHEVWTIGHSTRPLDAFVALLADHRIEVLADVRRFPGSRHNPQYQTAGLAAAMPGFGIEYRHFPALGGRRRTTPDSPNLAWRNASFRGYADYMASGEFAAAFAELFELAGRRRLAMMCAELLWWRCHRSMLADDFSLRGWKVMHILAPGQLAEHAFRVPARLVDGQVVYAATDPA